MLVSYIQDLARLVGDECCKHPEDELTHEEDTHHHICNACGWERKYWFELEGEWQTKGKGKQVFGRFEKPPSYRKDISRSKSEKSTRFEVGKCYSSEGEVGNIYDYYFVLREIIPSEHSPEYAEWLCFRISVTRFGQNEYERKRSGPSSHITFRKEVIRGSGAGFDEVSNEQFDEYKADLIAECKSMTEPDGEYLYENTGMGEASYHKILNTEPFCREGRDEKQLESMVMSFSQWATEARRISFRRHYTEETGNRNRDHPVSLRKRCKESSQGDYEEKRDKIFSLIEGNLSEIFEFEDNPYPYKDEIR